MRKSLVYASIVLVVLALAAFVATSPINAQMQPDGTYAVQPTDTLWDLSGVYYNNPLKWGQVVAQNPFLSKPGRQFINPEGKFIVVIRPGETLKGLGELNMTPQPVEVQGFVRPTPALGNNLAGVGSINSLTGGGITLPRWAWLLISLILLALARWWWKFTHPATSGAPLRHNGVDPLNTDDVIMWTTRLGRTRFGRLAEYPQETLHPRLVGNIEAGVINGIGRVGYHGGSSSIRLMRNEPGFRAWFQMPNGRREQLVFLQGCGNDVAFSGLRYTGFTFTPTGVAATIPVQQPVVAPVPVPQPRSTFGITEAREFDSLQGRTDADRRQYVMTLRHLGVQITLPDEVAHGQRSCKAAETQFTSAAEAARVEIAQITARLATLHEVARNNIENASKQRNTAGDLQRFLDSFIAPPTPPAPAAETAIAEAPAPERAVGTL